MEKPVKTLNDATTFGNQMLDLLKRQHQYFLELQRLAREQRALIKAQQNEELLHLLAKRQKIVEALGQLHRQLAPYRQNWPQMKSLLPEPLRNNIGALLSELQQMLNLIIEQDQQDCQELSASKQQVASELSQTNKAQAANAYYVRPGNQMNNNSAGSNFQITG
jgi:hypothetical protein